MDRTGVIQSCLIICDPMDYSLPGSSVHDIFQARILEWVAIYFSIRCYAYYQKGRGGGKEDKKKEKGRRGEKEKEEKPLKNISFGCHRNHRAIFTWYLQQVYQTLSHYPKAKVRRLITDGKAKECSNYRTIALISHASQVMLKILQARFQRYMIRELPDVQAGFRKARAPRDQIANVHWIMEKARKFQKNIYFCFIDYTKAFNLCGSQ